MKKNKGFTLIEVIATIIILSIIALVITPIITGLIRDTRTSIAEEQKEIIIRSAKKWATANVDLLPLEDNAYCIITLEQLMKSGYYEDKETIANPEGGEFDGFIYFRYKASSYDYKIEYCDNQEDVLHEEGNQICKDYDQQIKEDQKKPVQNQTLPCIK